MTLRTDSIIGNLQTLRSEILAELSQVDAAIAALSPEVKPKRDWNTSREVGKRQQQKIIETIGNHKLTAREIRQKTGFSESATYRVLARLVNKGKLARIQVNGVYHFSPPPEEVRIRAGYGEETNSHA